MDKRPAVLSEKIKCCVMGKQTTQAKRAYSLLVLTGSLTQVFLLMWQLTQLHRYRIKITTIDNWIFIIRILWIKLNWPLAPQRLSNPWRATPQVAVVTDMSFLIEIRPCDVHHVSIILCDIMIIREISLMMLWNYYHKLFLTIVYKNLDKVVYQTFLRGTRITLS